MHGDNFQALNLLQRRYQEKVKCVYIDPPYNTASGLFHTRTPSSIHLGHNDGQQVSKLRPLIPENWAIFVSIDKHERQNLDHILSINFGEDNHIEELIWAMNTNNSQAPNYSTNHDMFWSTQRIDWWLSKTKVCFREPKPGFAEVMELVARLNPQYTFDCRN